LHLSDARELASPAKATVRAEKRRCGRPTRRRGGGAPATGLGRRSARERKQAAPAGGSPPCAAPDAVHGGERATTAAGTEAAALGFWVAAAHGLEQLGHGGSVWGSKGRRRAINSPGGSSPVACGPRGDAGARSDSCSSPARRRPQVGDDRWSPPVGVSGSGREAGYWWCWAGGRTVGPAACWAALLCGAVGPEGWPGGPRSGCGLAGWLKKRKDWCCSCWAGLDGEGKKRKDFWGFGI
jgi:hypothetical protein